MNYSIKIVDGHHIVDMSYKPSDIETALQKAIKHYADAIKAVADGIHEKWRMK